MTILLPWCQPNVGRAGNPVDTDNYAKGVSHLAV